MRWVTLFTVTLATTLYSTTILVATDGSEAAGAAEQVGVALAARLARAAARVRLKLSQL